MLRSVLILTVVALLSGCATANLGKPKGPAERCMKKAPKLPLLGVGEDLVNRYAELQGQYTDMAQRKDCLERYVQQVTK